MEQQLVPFHSRKSGLVKIENRTFARRGYKSDGLLDNLSNPVHGQVGQWTELESVVRLFENRISETGRKRMRKTSHAGISRISGARLFIVTSLRWGWPD